MEQTYHYYAFISYATEDSKWAKWLQHQLSYYHIPSVVKKSQIGIPQKLRPIFVYEYDLVGNQLHKEIEKELVASKYLIVICSPDAAKSTYVNREVNKFIALGRKDRIIPFIVDGEVGAENPAEECFPPALLELIKSGKEEDEIRGANIATNGKRQALVDIVATMLGVRRDVLWNRYKMRLLRQRIAWGVVAFVAMLAGLLYWDYTRPTYEYYADYVDVWGVPKGIIELDKEQVKHRYGTYRFEYRRVPIGCDNPYSDSNRRVVAVNYVNSQGTIMEITQTEHMDRYPVFSIGYDNESGMVKSLIFSQADGKKVVEYELSDEDGVVASNVDIKRVSAGRGVASIRANTTAQPDDENLNSNAKITRIHYVRDEDTGVILGKTYHRNNDRLEESKICDAYGVGGEFYDLDSLGRIVKRTYIDNDGDIHSLAGGVSSKNYEYSEDGDIIRTECRGINGELVNNDQGWAIGISEVDKAALTETEYYLNAAGLPCFNMKEGYHKGIVILDDRYLPIELQFYDINGNLCRTKKNYASMKVKCDKLGRIVESSYFDENGKPCYELDLECHKAKLEYVGKSNKQSTVSTYDINGNLVLCKEGFAIMEVKYLEDRGNSAELVSFFDTNKERTFNNSGVSSVINLYEGGLYTEVRNYGIDNIRTEDFEGCAYYKFKYDDKGNIVVVGCYNKIEQLKAQINQDYAILLREYNDYGQQTFERYYDATATAYSTIRFEYDEVGNATKMIWLNGDETEWVVDSEGYAAIEIDYDVRRNAIERRFYGVDQQPVEYGGAIREENVFNNLNQCVETKYFDSYNNLSKIERYTYDDRGNLIEIDYYNGQGRPYLKDSKATRVVYKYTGYQQIGEEYYRGDQLCDGPGGYAKMEIEYNERNKPIKMLLYDESNRLRNDSYAVVSIEYDERNNVTRRSYYNCENKLTMNDEGYAVGVTTYDKLGNLCEEYYLNEEEELIPIYGEIAKVVKEYDDKGRECSTSYYDATNQLYMTDDGYAKYIIEYDENGNTTKVAFYDAVNELVDGPYGFALNTTKYNTNGMLTADTYRNAIEELVLGPNGYAEYVVEYDDNGNQVNEAFYGTEGELVDSPNGYARNTTCYDDGKMTDTYYNAWDELVIGPNGYASAVATYDSNGKMISITFYDAEGNDITEQFAN